MTTYGPYPATVADWHDGDTAHVGLDLGFGLILSLSARIYGINAPELSTPMGKQALAVARQICPPGSKVTILSHGWDKYGGRFDATITLWDGSDFAQLMLNSGNAVVFNV